MTITITRPNGIALFQLLAARSALKLEKVGLRHSRGAVRKVWALKYGLKANAKHDEVIEAINNHIKDLEEKGDLGINQV